MKKASKKQIAKQLDVPEQILGACCGIRFVPRDSKELPGPFSLLAQLMIEDDGYWHTKDFTINVYWLTDLERVVKAARRAVKVHLSKTNEEPI